MLHLLPDYISDLLQIISLEFIPQTSVLLLVNSQEIHSNSLR